VERFLEKYNLELICRAHQVVEDGYELMFDRKVVTLFSAPNYCGEFDNAGAIMVVNKDLVVSFKVLRPASHKVKFPELFPDYIPEMASESSDSHQDLKECFMDHIPSVSEIQSMENYDPHEVSTDTDESVLYG
jgi:hypothetical protein